MNIVLKNSNKTNKRFQVKIDKKTIHFGLKGGSTYIDHKDDNKKAAWIARHKVREIWTKSGIKTAGFWSRWLLWEEPSLTASIKKIEKKFGVNIKYE